MLLVCRRLASISEKRIVPDKGRRLDVQRHSAPRERQAKSRREIDLQLEFLKYRTDLEGFGLIFPLTAPSLPSGDAIRLNLVRDRDGGNAGLNHEPFVRNRHLDRLAALP